MLNIRICHKVIDENSQEQIIGWRQRPLLFGVRLLAGQVDVNIGLNNSLAPIRWYQILSTCESILQRILDK